MRGGAAPAAAALLALAASCATVSPGGPGAGGERPGAVEVREALLARNAGIGELRALVEARISFAGREASFPGVLLLRRPGGFRLDLLDPLDRPLAIVFAEGDRLVQYRPAEGLAASLGPFPGGCSGLGAGEWAGTVLADGAPFHPGERPRISSFFGWRSLEISRAGQLRQSLRYEDREGGPRPIRASWYCEEEPVMELRLGAPLEGARWRLPRSFSVAWPRAGLSVKVDLREVETGAAPGRVPLAPRVDPGTRWTVWNVLQ